MSTVLAAKAPGNDPYPSRIFDRPRSVPRQEPPVFGGPQDGPLTARQLADYERDGFVVVDRLLDDDHVAACRDALRRFNRDDEIKTEDWVITEPGGEDVRSVFAVHRNDAVLKEMCSDPWLLAIARQILDSDVYIHQSRINFKPGFKGREFYWHSDFETWHTEDGLPRMKTFSISISLTDNEPASGPLMLIPGSHTEFISCVGETPEDNYRRSLKRQDIGVPDRDSLERLVDDGGIRMHTGRAGSAVIFDCNVMHGSNSNITPSPRSNLFIVFNSADNLPERPFAAPRPRPDWLGEQSPDLPR